MFYGVIFRNMFVATAISTQAVAKWQVNVQADAAVGLYGAADVLKPCRGLWQWLRPVGHRGVTGVARGCDVVF